MFLTMFLTLLSAGCCFVGKIRIPSLEALHIVCVHALLLTIDLLAVEIGRHELQA